ncbi:MAG TPA: DUF3536 domain-containing protein [bacterium]|nr:DUF3536 domain-containing protein [bacterium]
MTRRFVCIHGHFYQPPREDPKTGEVPVEPSAAPHRDWNRRITDECYYPNVAARTYGRMSFDFGPTLLAWLETHAHNVYRGILDADLESRERFGGHGSALAMGYNHMILPLANARDKKTQILWGLKDFEHRFGRRSEGFWFPETAVDLEGLEILAEHGVRFTVLAPHQARTVRERNDHYWQKVPAGEIDATMPYELNLPSGRRMAVFFYDGAISRAIAFEGLLHSGDALVDRMMRTFSEDRVGPQLVSLATDGESYGHHHKFGEMALDYALKRIERDGLARLANFGSFLEACEPTHEVEIRERTSWSCPHGVERWRGDCGCRTGTGPGGQTWRQPLREALDWLRDTLEPVFEIEASEYLTDPWRARDDYIGVLVSKGAADFFAVHAVRPLAPREQADVLRLMELQRHLMFMYTSCGWFFDDPWALGTLQVLKFARRALELAAEAFGADLKPEFERRLGPQFPDESRR